MTLQYNSLHPTIQRWVHDQGWNDLRPIQKKAIPHILGEKSDILISASTAAGKTESFFLPALTKAANDTTISILHISPLKALINDQYRRLLPLCQKMNISITPWHGDSNASKKERLKRNPNGILMITPESLEAMIMNHPSWILNAFRNIRYVCIDEFHAFIGTERGYQLTSLLNRIEILLDRTSRPIPRVALSATLGDLESIPSLLRPAGNFPCKILTEKNSSAKLHVSLQGFYAPNKSKDKTNDIGDRELTSTIFEYCRGGSHLVFANNRQRTENLSAALSKYSQSIGVANEFFPHHGSLDKILRQELEARLQKETLPTTAICTNTLELGIDIGPVKSVLQVTPPMSVSSLRQRIGRSGRRGDASILRLLITEEGIDKDSHIVDRLRMGLIQTIAMMHLLLIDKWFEPASREDFHFSTLLQQILSCIAQHGSLKANKIFYILCQTGPFNLVTDEMFICLLRKMGHLHLITQTSDGEITLGLSGEKVVSKYTFYAAFNTPQEFTIKAFNKSIGKLPVESALSKGQNIVFAGKYWTVESIDYAVSSITVSPGTKGSPPRFGGSSASISEVVRQKMYSILINDEHQIKAGNSSVSFLDKSASNLFAESIRAFKDYKLDKQSAIYLRGNVFIFPWSCDRITNTIASILLRQEHPIGLYSGVIEAKGINKDIVKECLLEFVDNPLSEEQLSSELGAKLTDKYDEALPEELLNIASGIKSYDIKGAIYWIKHNSSKF